MKGHIYCSNLKKLYYFLFNNLLLLTKQQTDKVDTTVRPKYKLLYMVSLLDVSMTPNTNDKGRYIFLKIVNSYPATDFIS